MKSPESLVSIPEDNNYIHCHNLQWQQIIRVNFAPHCIVGQLSISYVAAPEATLVSLFLVLKIGTQKTQTFTLSNQISSQQWIKNRLHPIHLLYNEGFPKTHCQLESCDKVTVLW